MFFTLLFYCFAHEAFGVVMKKITVK